MNDRELAALQAQVLAAPRPWVVLDLSTVTALSWRDGLPGNFSVVIPDRLLAEATHKPTIAKQERVLDALNQLIRHPRSAGRVLIGDYWREVSRREPRPSRLQRGPLAAIELGLSMHLVHAQEQRDDNDDLLSTVPTERDGDDPGKSLFCDEQTLVNEWIESTARRKLRARLRSENPYYRLELIRGPFAEEQVARMAMRRQPSKYRRAAWQRELKRTPSRAAVARWERIRLWHFIDGYYRQGESPKKTGNKYDDTHYAFLSLYTGHLWTHDRGLMESVQAIDRRVRVHFRCDGKGIS